MDLTLCHVIPGDVPGRNIAGPFYSTVPEPQKHRFICEWNAVQLRLAAGGGLVQSLELGD